MRGLPCLVLTSLGDPEREIFTHPQLAVTSVAWVKARLPESPSKVNSDFIPIQNPQESGNIKGSSDFLCYPLPNLFYIGISEQLTSAYDAVCV